MSLVSVVAIVLSMCGNLRFCKADEHQYDATNDQRQMDSNQPLGKLIISHSILAERLDKYLSFCFIMSTYMP